MHLFRSPWPPGLPIAPLWIYYIVPYLVSKGVGGWLLVTLALMVNPGVCSVRRGIHRRSDRGFLFFHMEFENHLMNTDQKQLSKKKRPGGAESGVRNCLKICRAVIQAQLVSYSKALSAQLLYTSIFFKRSSCDTCSQSWPSRVFSGFFSSSLFYYPFHQ